MKKRGPKNAIAAFSLLVLPVASFGATNGVARLNSVLAVAGESRVIEWAVPTGRLASILSVSTSPHLPFPPLAELVPTNGTIRLTVPPATQPGEYQVELTGRNEDGRLLTATVGLSVSAVTLPRVSLGRNPVILLNGFQLICTDSASTLAASVGTFGQMASLLQSDRAAVAFFNNCSYGDIRIEQLAAQLQTYLAGLTYTDGSPVTQVDIVAHSMGGLITRAYLAGLQTDGSLLPPQNPKVGKIVLIATPNFGSFQAPRVGIQAPELVPGSAFLWSLARWNQAEDDLRGLDALAIIGDAGSYYSQGNLDDGVVSLTSASLSFARSDQRTRVVPYCHVTPDINTAFGTVGMICAGAQGIADIDQPSHDTAQIVRSFLSGTSDWTSIGQTPNQMPWWSQYGGIYFAVENASGSQYYNDLTQVSLGTVVLHNGGAANAVFYDEFIEGTGTLQFTSSSLGTVDCGLFTPPSGYFLPVRCKYGPNITSVAPLMSNAPGIQVQSGANPTIRGNGFGQQCGTCKVVASPGNNSLTVSAWSDNAITLLLPASLTGLVQLTVRASGGSDSINIMAASAAQASTPALSISKTHSGTFASGQTGAVYTLTVSNASTAGPTTGAVTVTEAVPSGLTLVSMVGSGWNCSGSSCVRTDALSAGTKYPPITVTVNVASNAPSQVTNQVTVSGGGSVSSSASDVTTLTSGLATSAPVITAFQNAATFQDDGGVDGSWVQIKGSNLAPDTPAGRIWRNGDFTSTSTLPTALDGVSVTIDGKTAALYYISPTQINAQVPATGTTGPVSVVVTTSKGVSPPFTGQIAAYAPGLFMLSQGGFKYPAAVISDGTYLGPAGLFGSAAVTRPARPGESISLYGTGFGLTSPAIAPGTWGWAPAQTAQTVTATIGGVDAHVDWAGLVSPGEYQINLVVPQGLADGEYPMLLRIAGVSTQSSAFVAVQSPMAQNPVPTITSLSPSSATAGTNSLTLTINGTGFIGASIVTFGGTAHTPTFISSSQLTIALTGSDLAAAGSYAVVVTNPAPGGGASSPAIFLATNPQNSGIVLQGKLFQIDGTLTISGTALRFEIQAAPTGASHFIAIDDEFALPSFPQLTAGYTATGAISGNTATFSSMSVTGIYEADPTKFASLNSATLVINFTSLSSGSSVTGTLTLSTSGGTVQGTFTGSLTAIG